MDESEEIVEVVDSTPSWRRKGRVIVAASLVILAPIVVLVVALAAGDEPASATAATLSTTSTTERPAATTSNPAMTTTTPATTTTTTTIVAAPPAPATTPTAPLPPLSVSISLEGPTTISGCSETGAECYWIVPSFAGVSGNFELECHGAQEYFSHHALNARYPAQWTVGICAAAAGHNLELWAVVYWNGQVATSNIIHLP